MNSHIFFLIRMTLILSILIVFQKITLKYIAPKLRYRLSLLIFSLIWIPSKIYLSLYEFIKNNFVLLISNKENTPITIFLNSNNTDISLQEILHTPIEIANDSFLNNLPLIEIWLVISVIFIMLELYKYILIKKQLLKFAQDKNTLNKKIKLFGVLLINRKINIYRANSQLVPCALGVLNPNIYLPIKSDCYKDDSFLLLHEIMHIQSMDIPIRMVLTFLKCILWFHPLYGVFCNNLLKDQELSCDSKVLNTLSIKDKIHYGQLILKHAAKKNSMCIAAYKSSNIKNRINEILFPIRTNTSLYITSIVSFVLIVFIINIIFVSTNIQGLSTSINSIYKSSFSTRFPNIDIFFNEYNKIETENKVDTPYNVSEEFVCPIRGDYKIARDFGHTFDSNSQPHTGLDIVPFEDMNVYASGSGKVEKVITDEASHSGIVIIISHGEKNKTLYASLISACVKEGDIIKKNSIIGTVGNVEGSTGPHLHFEFLLNNEPINPIINLENQ